MCIIHNCLTASFAAHRLESAGNAGVCRQPCHDFLYRHTEQNTRPCRTQCVVYAEPSGRMQVYRIPLALPEHIKCRTVCGNVNAFRRQISLAVHADCVGNGHQHRAGSCRTGNLANSQGLKHEGIYLGFHDIGVIWREFIERSPLIIYQAGG